MRGKGEKRVGERRGCRRRDKEGCICMYMYVLMNLLQSYNIQCTYIYTIHPPVPEGIILEVRNRGTESLNCLILSSST